VIQRDQEKEKETYAAHLKTFLTEAERIFTLFKELMAEAEPWMMKKL